MRFEWRSAAIVLLSAALALSAGCGSDKKDDSTADSERFRVPDSLLSPIEAYNLTVDEYHPVNGGIMANKDVELRYPARDIARFIATRSFSGIIKGYEHVKEDIGRPTAGKLVIIGALDLPEYAVMTRKEWWYYGWIKGDTIYSEPLDILLKRWDPITGRTLSEVGFTQRMAQMALDGLSGGRIPVWMKESAASYVADERLILRIQISQYSDILSGFSPPLDELEAHIHEGTDMAMSRLSYFFVYRMLENLLEKHEFASVTRFARLLGKGATLDEASITEFGLSYREMIEAVRPADILDGAGPIPEPEPEVKEGHDHDHDH
ncbi:MAG: hypothetical protein KAU49_00500 [Candidatus Krumholzibacteria bacterium]|nr:hypothetical protein [Candidatus Krumholzibacteria bacterium]